MHFYRKKMRLFAIILLLTAWNLPLFSQGYRMEGTISPSMNGKFIHLFGIDYSSLNPVIRDSALISNGKFQFNGKINTPGLLVSIYIPSDHRLFSQFFIENRNISVHFPTPDSSQRYQGLITRNNPITTQYREWKKATDSLYIAVWRFNHMIDSLENKHAPDTAIAAVKANQKIYSDALRESKMRFIRQHPDYYISLYWLRYDLLSRLSSQPDVINALYKGLTPAVQQLPEGKALAETITIITKLQPGKMLPSFSVPDTSGNIVKLDNFKGRYLLLDFWASWCGPCIASIPAMKELHEAWKSKGLEIVSISLDDNRDKWLQAVRTHQMPWTQVSQLQGWKSPVAREYNIQFIPQVILVDKTGKILSVASDDISRELPAFIK